MYVAFILDVYAQRIVAWHTQTTRTVDLVLRPLQIALWERDRTGRPIKAGQLIAHSDAGSQYTALAWCEKLELDGIAPSIGSVGDAYDNALMESINGVYKTECIRTTVFHDGPYKTIADVEFATAGWVDWYNHRRLHGSLGMIPPAEFEEIYYAAPPGVVQHLRAAENLGRFGHAKTVPQHRSSRSGGSRNHRPEHPDSRQTLYPSDHVS